MEQITEHNQRASNAGVKIAILLAIAIISILLRNVVSNPDFFYNRSTIESLDEKQDQAIVLTAAATAASITVSMLPDDVGSSIAAELGNITSKLTIVVAAIVFEKYMFTIFLYLTFLFLIPCACILGAVGIYTQSYSLKQWMVKLLLLSIVLCVTIPVCEKISSLIKGTYEVSIEETVNEANDAVEEYEAMTETESERVTESEIETEAEEKGFWQNVGDSISGAASSASDAVSGLAGSAVESVEGIVGSVADATVNGVKRFGNILDGFVKSLAIMIVLCCGMPIVALVVMVYAIKQIFGMNINIDNAVRTIGNAAPNPARIAGKKRRDSERNKIDKTE